MPDETPDFEAMLRALAAHQVEFIVVGGVCAVLQGAPVTTYDLDVVHSRSPENVERLIRALAGLDARFREPAGRRIGPGRSHLASPGHQLLVTRLGPLDLLGSVSGGAAYEDLLARSEVMSLEDGLQVRVLDLATLIDLKTRVGREKDLMVLAVLRRTLEEKQRH